jgi:DNA polymerase-3 subunit epsilon/ATP-dependent DNA helicase DinG
MSPIVAIDIETTGLDPRTDSIIEIGAVKFDGKRVIDTWQSLINPARLIPPEITQLTGITNEMVRNSPTIKEKLEDFIGFVGDYPVLGQNVAFDLSFLQKFNILRFNDVVDTHEMATVLLPTSSRYGLGTLGQVLNIPLPNSHRALDDATLTHAVYIKLYEKALTLPIELLAEICRLGETLDWNGSWIFNQILKARSRDAINNPPIKLQQFKGLNKTDSILEQPLNPAKELSPLNEDEIAALLEHGGPFSKSFQSFEQRPQQLEMLRAVTRAFNQSQHLMAEAGTGTGKSLAYLIPAAMWSLQNSSRVVISTNTLNLQDQLVKKDIPDMIKALNLNLRVSVLKGRSNYLCPRRLENMRQRGPDSPEAMRVLAKILVWLYEGGMGDRSEINLGGAIEREVWSSKLSAEDEGCKTETCLSRMGGICPFFRAHQSALSSHILIVNHALLLADVITGSRILPDYNYLIVDEAHHLETATTDALTFRLTQYDFDHLMKELGGSSSGILGSILRQLKDNLNPSELAAIHDSMQKATDFAFRLEHDFSKFFTALDEFLESGREGPIPKYGQQLRIIDATRTQPDWTNVEIAWDGAAESLNMLINHLTSLQKSIGDLVSSSSDEFEDSLDFLGSINRRLMEIEINLHAWVSEPDNQQIYWAEVKPNNMNIAIQVAPLQVGPLMEQYLWHEKSSIILTSATLTTNGEFDYLRSRLSADEADELFVGSPFDYENSALLYMVNDIPEPSDAHNFQRAIENLLPRLGKATGGRMLVLFTSYDQLRRTSRAIAPLLSKEDILVYEQGEGASSHALLESFRESEHAVLLGTRSFWEGVDIVGEALSVLVIVKLPFDVPSDPIVAARSETFEDPFSEYHVPEAILRFRQGFGRLIRTQSDRGLVVVLDRRILTKRYGKMFIDSLPDCTKKTGLLNDLPAVAKKWLNL